MAILVLFEQFLGEVCLYFWLLLLSASPNMIYFVRTVSIMRAIVMNRFEIVEKFCSFKALLKMASGGMHSPHPPGSAPDCQRIAFRSHGCVHFRKATFSLSSKLIGKPHSISVRLMTIKCTAMYSRKKYTLPCFIIPIYTWYHA